MKKYMILIAFLSCMQLHAADDERSQDSHDQSDQVGRTTPGGHTYIDGIEVTQLSDELDNLFVREADAAEEQRVSRLGLGHPDRPRFVGMSTPADPMGMSYFEAVVAARAQAQASDRVLTPDRRHAQTEPESAHTVQSECTPSPRTTRYRRMVEERAAAAAYQDSENEDELHVPSVRRGRRLYGRAGQVRDRSGDDLSHLAPASQRSRRDSDLSDDDFPHYRV